MIFYFINLYSTTCSDIIKKRNPILFEAGRLRSQHILKTINKKVTVVSLSISRNKGFFREKKEVIDDQVNVIHLRTLNILKLRRVFSLIFSLIYMLKHIRKKDRIIVYNADPLIIFPLLIFKKIKKIAYVLQIEELYSSYKYKYLKGSIYNWSESLGIKYANSYIINNEGIVKYLPAKRTYIVNRGYKTRLDDNYSIFSKTRKEIPIILYSGRLDFEGGIEVFLDSLKYIKKECKVIISGKGPLNKKVACFDDYNDNIVYSYLGFVSRKQFKELLIQAQICINPTRVKEKFSSVSFPSKVLQYLEYGNILISSCISEINNLGDLKEYIYIYHNDSSLELATLINDLIYKTYDKLPIVRKVDKYFYKQDKTLKNFMN
jgi:glycosyltransferase involved in cell wall biosynthesis